ncbi:hypothetical protein AB0M34_33695 [Nocardia sp. NPDC050193]
MIAVGAVDSTGKRADFSQTGPFLPLEPPPTNELGPLPAVLCVLGTGIFAFVLVWISRLPVRAGVGSDARRGDRGRATGRRGQEGLK